MYLLFSSRLNQALLNTNVVFSIAIYEGHNLQIPTDGIYADLFFLA
jgi:hypothetical protein